MNGYGLFCMVNNHISQNRNQTITNVHHSDTNGTNKKMKKKEKKTEREGTFEKEML